MADSAVEVLSRALSGHGINEKAMIETLGSWDHEEKKLFRKRSSHFFSEDERSFERWEERGMRLLKHEFMRFKNAVVLWTTHPWERDARLVKEALSKGHHGQNINILIEVACTRSSDELLGARKAYHSLFDHSIEEDVASHVNGPERKLLVALMSAYRYEGPKYKEETAKSEAKKLFHLIREASIKKSGGLIEDDEVVRILSTRSKHYLHALYKHYNQISAGENLDEDLHGDLRLQEVVMCLANPVKYFTQNLDVSLKVDADKKIKKVLTRIVVTRADTDMKEIKVEFKNQFGVSLAEKIESVCNGSYKDFLLSLLARSD